MSPPADLSGVAIEHAAVLLGVRPAELLIVCAETNGDVAVWAHKVFGLSAVIQPHVASERRFCWRASANGKTVEVEMPA